jgi:hypothetical protein
MSQQEELIPHGHRGPVTFRCWPCKDVGALMARLKEAPTLMPFAFLCSCAAAERKPRAYPVWPGPQAGFEIIE